MNLINKLFKFEDRDDRIVGQILFFKFKITKSLNNKIYVIKNGKKKLLFGKIKGLRVKFRGRNNTVEIAYPTCFRNSVFCISGENNLIKIDETKYTINNLEIDMDNPCKNKTVHIKKNVSMTGAEIHSWESDSKIIIGEDCMLSWGISIRSGDGHIITNKNSTEKINFGKDCIIGNHVWIGQNVHITKNVKIGNNCIIGECSVVTKSFEEDNIAIAGVPAKIIKRDIDWIR